MNTYTYTDSEAGTQNEEFKNLSEIIKYIEEFGYHGDSLGIVMQDGEEIIQYISKETGITWKTT